MRTDILKTISLIRDSFDGSEIVYTSGSCVKFSMILLHLYPQGRILYDLDHAIFEYEGSCYDINGVAIKGRHIPLEDYGLLQSFTSMNLKYKKRANSKVITRLINCISRYWKDKNIEKVVYYTNRLKKVTESTL